MFSSLFTTLINTFFTTAKNVVRVIRQTWVSLVQAAKVLIFNPDKLPFAERMRAALRIIAAGASVVLGTVVQESVSAALAQYITVIPLGMGTTIQGIVSTFAGTLCTGFLTISLLYFIDSDPFEGFFTGISSVIDYETADYVRQARLFEEYAAKLAGLDIDRFDQEADLYLNLAESLASATDDFELNTMLTQTMEKIGITIPWGEDRSLDDFMKEKKAVLRFEV